MKVFAFSCFLTSKKVGSQILNRSAQTYAQHYKLALYFFFPPNEIFSQTDVIRQSMLPLLMSDLLALQAQIQSNGNLRVRRQEGSYQKGSCDISDKQTEFLDL